MPAGPVYDVKEMSEDPHTIARGMIERVPAATGGDHGVIAHPVKYSATPASIRRGAPLVGEHSREVLAEYGFAGDERFVGITMGETANVLGYRAMVDWVIPTFQDLRLATQFESVIRDLDTSDSDDTAWIFEAIYSATTSLSLMLDYRWELHRSMGETNNAIYLSLILYAR